MKEGEGIKHIYKTHRQRQQCGTAKGKREWEAGGSEQSGESGQKETLLGVMSI